MPTSDGECDDGVDGDDISMTPLMPLMQMMTKPGSTVRAYADYKAKAYTRVVDTGHRPNNSAARAVIWPQEGRPGEGAKETVNGLSNYAAQYT